MRLNLKRLAVLMSFLMVLSVGCGPYDDPDTKTYMVTYDSNGATSGTAPTDTTDYVEGQTVTVAGNTGPIERDGYAFVGWTLAANGTGTTYNAGQTFTIATNDVVLHAKWSDNPTSRLTYDGNGATSGQVPSVPVDYEEGISVTVAGNSGNLTRTGYSFLGWSLNAGEDEADYVGGSSLTILPADMTLYAIWTENQTWILTYDSNGATVGNVPAQPANYEASQSITMPDNTGNLERSGFVFSGWCENASGTGTTYSAGETFTMPAAAVTLYVKWNPAYTLTYDSNGATGGQVPSSGSYEEDYIVDIPGNTGSLVRTDYTFSGWCENASGTGTTYTTGQEFTMPAAAATLYAKWVEFVEPSGLYVADYTIAKESVLRRIPESALTQARDSLHIVYSGTSHSTQVMSGMAGLAQYKTGDDTKFAFTYGGSSEAGKLDIHYRGASGTDLSHDGLDGDGHTGYFRGTVAYLDAASHSDVNVVMWSWCSIEGHVVQRYLDNFDELTEMYSAGGSKGRTANNAVTFVWMTGYARGSNSDDPTAANSPYNNHKAIVDHCRANGYFCLDYWSQDAYNYGDDSYKPTESGNANVQHYNWVQNNTVGQDWFECRNWSTGAVDYPAHTDDNSTYAQHLTGNRRAYAAWWIWARIAGWDGTLQ